MKEWPKFHSVFPILSSSKKNGRPNVFFYIAFSTHYFCIEVSLLGINAWTFKMNSYVKWEISTVLYVDQKILYHEHFLFYPQKPVPKIPIFLSQPRYLFISVHTWICNHQFAKACTNPLASSGSTHFASSARYLTCPVKISHYMCARGLAHYICCSVPGDPEGDASCVLHLTLPALPLGSSHQFLQ